MEATEEELNTFWAMLCYLYGGAAGEGSTMDTEEKKLITNVAEISGLTGYEMTNSEMYSGIASDAAASVTEEELRWRSIPFPRMERNGRGNSITGKTSWILR